MSQYEFTQNIAVIIGINNYQNGIPPLGTAQQDAIAIADILEQDYHYKLHPIIDYQPTKQQLEQLLNIDLPNLIQTSSSRLIFYFAGHGIALNGDEGPQGYLIPQDGKLGDVSTYLPMETVEAALSKLSCRHCFVILDCCFAGAFRWSSTRDIGVIPEVIYKERYDRFIQDPAWQIITSAGYDQTALDNLDLKNDRGIAKNQANHSPFATALMEALRGNADVYPPAKNGKPAGDGIITATELYLYLRDSVEVPTYAIKKRQTPQIWSLKKHDKGEFIFLIPGHPLNLPFAPSLDNLEENNPYRGLKSYEKKHSNLFFGRTALIKQLYEFISHSARPLTVVLGASGSGKSSLVKAGLMAYLDPLPQWKTLTPIRPGEFPLNRLNTLIKELDDNSKTLHQAIANWSRNHPHQKLLLVIDQLEELITLSRDESEREQFLQILANLATTYDNQLRIVITLRSDFESQFSNTLLTDYWQEGRFIVPAMSRNDLREVIEEPASAKMVYFESLEDKGYLVDRLIDEVADMPGALPLLSFALSELYLKLAHRYLEGQKTGDTVDRVITWQDYDQLGGVIKSLTRRADEEYNALVKEDAAYAITIRHVMLRMVAIGGELARRRVYQKELVYPEPEYGRVKTFIKRFDEVRLLISDQDERGEYVEPAHDALVTGWDKLLTWKKEEEETLILQRRLTPAAMEWEQVKENYQTGLFDKANPVINGIDRGFLLVENLLFKLPGYLIRRLQRSQEQQRRLPTQFLWNSNPYLDVLDQEIKEEDNWLNKAEREFIQASVLQKRRNGSWRVRIVIAVMLVLSGLIGAGLTQQKFAELNKANSLGRLSLSLFDEGKELDAFVEAIRARKILQKHKINDPDVMRALIRTVYEGSEKNQFHCNCDWVMNIDFHPNGQILASGGGDGTIKLWNLETGELIRTLKGQNDTISSISFNGNSKILASSSINHNIIEIWNLETGKVIRTLKEHNEGVQSVSFSFDGKTLASGSNDNTIKLWDVKTGEVIHTLKGHNEPISSVSFSPNGKILASGSDDNTVKLWNLETGELIRTLKGHNDSGFVTSLSFSPNGQLLASGSNGSKNGSIILWNIKTGQIIKNLENREVTIWSVSFSPDGKSLASGSGSDDNTVKLWDIETGELIRTLKGHNDRVRSVSFSPDSKTLASSSDDGRIQFWNVQLRQPVSITKAHDNGVYSVSFHPDGKILASGGRDGTIKLWDVEKGEIIHTFNHDNGSVWNIIFNPDGKILASSGDDGTIKLWDVKRTELLNTLNHHTGLVRRINFSPEGKILASGGDDGTIKLWDVEKGQLIHTLNPYNEAIVSISFSPNGKLLAASGINSKTIKIWNLQTQKYLEPLVGHDTAIQSLSFSPDNKILASGSDQGIIKLWKSNKKQESFTEIFSITTYGNVGAIETFLTILSLNFSRDSQILASGSNSNSNTVQIWDSNTGNSIYSFNNHSDSVNGVSFNPKRNILASGSDDQSIKLWDIDLNSLIERSCEKVWTYLHNSSANLSESDRHLCDDILSEKLE
ncbi:nSTAND1 domain-containing NTPase [Crocosphaera chwakensis]|uniref:Peptidase C14, caspase catalytic subunit p20 n=1 Tax=Crocosphaera chwakensis CCY0110 TaxID=391612 RepID=A3IRL3_9CHRO|nr:caspase family protein [Crocosphaera chwakensis]EAZ90862.1 Peptidase C14, caspase catalytic subunit p20 [Crocosphaera chwakensis CCY0110]